MNMGLIIILGLFFILLLVIGSIVAAHNDIIRGKNQAKRAWSDVVAYELKKLKILPGFRDALEEYKEFEKDVLEKITTLRSSLSKLSQHDIEPEKMQEVRDTTQGLLRGLNVTFEAYPNLKSSDLYSHWMKELSDLEGNITAAIAIFNEAVEAFNNSIQTFPSSAINNLWNKEGVLNTFTDTKASGELEYQPNF